MDKYINLIKAFAEFLLKLLKGVGLKDAEDYKTYAEQLIDGAAKAFASDDE